MGACLYVVHLLLPKTIQHFYDKTRSYGNEYYLLSSDQVWTPSEHVLRLPPLKPK